METRTPEGDAYLTKYPDVAAHHFYGLRPRQHYEDHGKAEGRVWDSTVATLPATSAPVVDEWPKLINQHGVNIMAVAPLHPEWRPSMQAWVMGHYPSTSVGDPSNAPKGYPPRSASGWPLVYVGPYWNGKEWIGTPVGPARFQCGESSYDTEAQALREARRIAESAGAPADPGWAKVYERMAEEGSKRNKTSKVEAPKLPEGEELL